MSVIEMEYKIEMGIADLDSSPGTDGYGAPRAAALALARIAGAPAAHLENLVLRQTLRYIREALACEVQMAEAAPELVSALFELVPRLDHDHELRRRVLTLKRNIHNHRTSGIDPDGVMAVANALGSAGQRTRLQAWFWAAKARDRALGQAQSVWKDDLARASGALAVSLQDPSLEQGIAIASPDLLSDLHRKASASRDSDWLPSSKLARSSLGYLSRAALKTSPLSTLTQVAMAEFERPGTPHESARPVARHSAVSIVRTLPQSLVALLARSAEFACAFQFEAYPGWRRVNQGVQVLAASHRRTGTFTWRYEAVKEERADPVVLDALDALQPGRRFSYDELVSAIAGADPAAAPQRILDLLDRNLVRPVAPYSRRDQRPVAALAGAIEALGSQPALLIASRLRQIQAETDLFSLACASLRLTLLDNIRCIAIEVYALLEQPSPDWLKTGKLLFENVAFDGAPVCLPDQVRQDLVQAAARLRPGAVRSKLYDYMCMDFVRRFGAQGESADALGFLFDFLARPDFPELLSRAIAEDKLAVKEGPGSPRSLLAAGASAAPPSLTIFFQVAANSAEALRRGEYELIVNQVNSGEGGLLGRFADALGPRQGDLAGKLEHWLHELFSGALPLELPVCGDAHNLQVEQGVCGRVLQWPGELPTTETRADATVPLARLRLKAAADGTLHLADDQGRPATVTYQGVVPPYMAPQALRLLMLIADPWMRDYSLGGDAGDKEPDESCVQFVPRLQEGRVIMQRAKWRVPANILIRREQGENDFDFFARVERWRAAHRLPEEVFAQVERNRLSLDAKERKPVWIHFGSPHALELLAQLAGRDEALAFTEVLPASSQHWVVSSHDGRTPDRRASEFLALVRWPMPQGNQQDPLRKASAAPHMRHSPDEWLYFKIYPSRYRELEQVLRHVIAPAVAAARATGDLQRWFFIRYADERGPHIRLRLRGPQSSRDVWLRQLSTLIEDAQARLPAAAPIDTHQQFAPSGDLEQRVFAPGCTLAPYQPEYEKYGGAAGVAIAEELFQASSEFALRAIDEVAAPSGRVRLNLALTGCMVALTQPSPEAGERFLRHYFWYWTGQDRAGADQVREKLRRAAGRRSALVLDGMEPSRLPGTEGRLVAGYHAALRCALAALDAAREEVSEPAVRLSFDYLHMHNNRMGLSPLEEAWVAALLLTQSPGARSGRHLAEMVG